MEMHHSCKIAMLKDSVITIVILEKFCILGIFMGIRSVLQFLNGMATTRSLVDLIYFACTSSGKSLLY